MNKLMASLMKGFKAFFDGWGNLTGTQYKHYNDGKFGVNWPIVTFMLFVIFWAVLLLPTGVADIFGWFWYE